MELQFLLLGLPALLGFISICKTLLRLLNWAWVTFFRPPKDLKCCYGSWALVTGAADGIGRAISIELASRGLNLILLDRDVPKLEATAKEILHERHDVEVRTLVSDLCKDSGSEIMRKIREVIEGLNVGVLINNAGMSYLYPRFLHEVDIDVVESIVRLNVEAATWVTKAVLPVMVKKRRGAVVNLGSASASLLPSFPLFTLYAATKAYVHVFSTSISSEYKHLGIDVQCQAPYLVATKLHTVKGPTIWVPSPRTFSRASVDSIGYEVICSPYWSHSLIWYGASLLPTSALNWLVHKSIWGIRKREQLIKDSTKGTKQG